MKEYLISCEDISLYLAPVLDLQRIEFSNAGVLSDSARVLGTYLLA